jgi:hypothetical protein
MLPCSSFSLSILFNAFVRYCQFRGLIGSDKVNTLRKREIKTFPDNMEEKFEKLRLAPLIFTYLDCYFNISTTLCYFIHLLFTIFRTVRQLANAGKTSEVLALATTLDPNFATEVPHLYFDLKQCEYVDCIAKCDFNKAMEIVRGCLGMHENREGKRKGTVPN